MPVRGLLAALPALLAAAGAAPAERGTCLMQLGISGFQRVLSLLDRKLEDYDGGNHPHTIVGMHTDPHTMVDTKTANDTSKEAAAAVAPVAVPLAVKVQATARDGEGGVLLQPAWSLLAELHVPVRLRDLHTGPHGPVRKFVKTLGTELARAGQLPESRLVVLDVRGEHTNYSLKSLDLLEHQLDLMELELRSAGPVHQTNRLPSMPSGDGAEQETIVDIEVLPMEHPGEKTAAEVLKEWQKQLSDQKSHLRQGPLAAPLQHATLVRVGPPLPADGTENEWGVVPLRSSAQTPVHGLWSLSIGIALATVWSV